LDDVVAPEKPVELPSDARAIPRITPPATPRPADELGDIAEGSKASGLVRESAYPAVPT
jgi:hypothetical protein